MNYPLSIPSPPRPDSRVPWHPETHHDIERLLLADLPNDPSLQISNRLTVHKWSVYTFSPRELRELMREFFFTHPTATFARAGSTVLAFCHPIDLGADEAGTLIAEVPGA